MEGSDFILLLIVYIILHPFRMLYKIYDRKRFRRKVVELSREVVDKYNNDYGYSHKKLNTYKIDSNVDHWLDTHNLDYYNRPGRYVVESCVQTIFGEIDLDVSADDLEDVSYMIGSICNRLYSPLYRTARKTVPWYKSFYNSIKITSFEGAIMALIYSFILFAIFMSIRIWYIDARSHRSLPVSAIKEIESSIIQADSILENASNGNKINKYNYWEVHDLLDNALYNLEEESH